MANPEHNGDQSTAIDVGAQQVATIYAKAFVGAAEDVGQTDALLAELDSLVDDVLRQHPQLVGLFASGFIDAEEKIGIVDRVFANRASPLLLNFLKVLAKHGRLTVIREVRLAVRQMVDELRGRRRVKVTTAAPLSGSETSGLKDTLQKMLGGQPVLDVQTDPDLIGGIVLHVGDTVYDGSVATQLRRAREQMINRSIHEIQSGRNRFSHPEGN